MDVRLLGPLEVSKDGRALEFRAKERTLLAVLLLHANETVSSERLIDELWGERPPARAQKVLATYVWQLRKALDDVLVTRSPGYALLVPPDRLDTAQFEQLVDRAQSEQPAQAAATLREALDLWRGPALADVTFESSARGDVARLDDERLNALAQRIDHDLALGQHEDVVAELHALVRAHPFRERFRAQLMLALYRCGRQAEALETYRDARQRFVDELGIEPGPELQRLERAILAHDPALDGSASSVVSPPSDAGPTTSLPRPASSFVGREQELRDVVAELEDGARLLTLTGPGGAGKTRLALEAAFALAPEFDAGARWVALAPLRDHKLVLETVAEAVGAKGRLAAHIGERKLLLLVDNLEHVIEAAPSLASLVAECPNLTMLVTSRERMRVKDEHEYPVPPLSATDAVSLFCKRARAEPSPEIEALCARLDFLPLAVELAAGRARALSPAQILERLDERLDLFEGGRDADPRQQTLRATIEWSYDLLSDDERRLFARLSVFPGGCDLDAATDVADADLETLQALVDKSLVRFASERYWMLVTVREFASERLAESGELNPTMERMARYLVALANEEGAPVFQGRAAEAFARLDLEHANVRAVVEWSVASDRPEHAAELLAVLRVLWASRSSMREVSAWAEHALRARGRVADELWPQVLLGLSYMRKFAGNLDGARDALEQALEALERIDPQPFLEANCLLELGVLAARTGRHVEARRRVLQSLELRQEHALPTGPALTGLGLAALMAGNLDEAASALEESLAALGAGATGVTEHNLAHAAHVLAEVARRRGDLDEAASRLDDALRGFAELRNVDVVAECLQDLAVVVKEQGELERAARIWDAASVLGRSASPSPGTRLFPRDIGELPEVEPVSRELTLEEALALATGEAD